MNGHNPQGALYDVTTDRTWWKERERERKKEGRDGGVCKDSRL